MTATIYIVKKGANAQLGIMARPRGGDWLEDDIASIAQQGFSVVVSLLEPEQERSLDLAAEAEACRDHNVEFVGIPIPDRGTPLLDDAILAKISSLAELLQSGKSLAIHCRMAYGRATMITACILVSCGEPAAEAVAAVTAARGVTVPETPEQLEWIHNYERMICSR